MLPFQAPVLFKLACCELVYTSPSTACMAAHVRKSMVLKITLLPMERRSSHSHATAPAGALLCTLRCAACAALCAHCRAVLCTHWRMPPGTRPASPLALRPVKAGRAFSFIILSSFPSHLCTHRQPDLICTPAFSRCCHAASQLASRQTAPLPLPSVQWRGAAVHPKQLRLFSPCRPPIAQLHLLLPPCSCALCSGVVLRVLFHPKQLMLVSAGDDAEVRVWDLVTRSCAAGEACTEKAELRWSAGGIASAGVGPGDPLLRTRRASLMRWWHRSCGVCSRAADRQSPPSPP